MQTGQTSPDASEIGERLDEKVSFHRFLVGIRKKAADSSADVRGRSRKFAEKGPFSRSEAARNIGPSNAFECSRRAEMEQKRETGTATMITTIIATIIATMFATMIAAAMTNHHSNEGVA